MKILVSTPTYNHQSHTRMVGNLMTEMIILRMHGHYSTWNYTVSSALAWARNVAVDMAIKQENDWLFFWDADISIEAEGFIEKMMELADEKGAGAVGIPYALKGMPIEYACHSLDGRRVVRDMNESREMRPGTVKETEFINIPEEPFEASRVGTGTMLIRVSELKKLEFPWFTFIDRLDENGTPSFWPEDYNFCDALIKNTKIYADPRFKTMHWGQFAFM